MAGEVSGEVCRKLLKPPAKVEDLSVLEASRRMRQGMDLTTGTFQTDDFNAWCEALARANGGED